MISNWERGLFYDFKILLVVAILAQAFHITHQYFFLSCRKRGLLPRALRDDTKNCCVADYRKRDKRKKSLTEFSADRGVL